MTYPVLLVHGLARFDILWSSLLGADHTTVPFIDKLCYFRGIRSFLTQNGFSTYCPTLPWAGGVDRRARALKQAVIHTLYISGASKINIIGHSMGGLDARHMLFYDRLVDQIHRKVASLTTISTPHEGSPFADQVLTRFHPLFKVLKGTIFDLSGFSDVTTQVCRRFNRREDVIEFENSCEGEILFQTFAGRQTYQKVSLLHRRSFATIYRLEGDNDGMVSVKSATWRERYFKGILDETEHFNEVGWISPDQVLRGQKPRELLHKIHQFYLDIVSSLP